MNICKENGALCIFAQASGYCCSTVCLGRIEKCPIIKPKRGHWIKVYGDHIHMGLRPWTTACSECGLIGQRTNYCPNCGARMENNNE